MRTQDRAKLPPTAQCKHCGLGINEWIHVEGVQAGMMRCGPESNLPYGYNAEPVGADCTIACMGYVDG